MAIDIVRGAIKNIIATNELVSLISDIQDDYNGTLYLAYPLSATADNSVTLDAMLLTREKGLIAFIFDNGNDSNEEQDRLYYQISYNLNNYESLRKGRKLAVNPVIISYFERKDIPNSQNNYLYANKDNLKSLLASLDDIDGAYYEKLTEALQKISTLKPRKRRKNVALQG